MQDSNNKLHPTKLVVSTKALHNNISVYRKHLVSGTKIMLMIKAFGYGNGDVEIAKYLEGHNLVDCLGVAYISEGVALREEGIGLPIMVMNTGIVDLGDVVSFNLEPTIYNPEQLKQLVALNPRDISAVKVHFKIDSGMHRLGFRLDEIPEALTLLQNHHVQVKAAYTHLSASPDKIFDDFTLEQINYFNRCYALLEEVLSYRPMRHVLNSAGILRFTEYQYEMVRGGMGIYGIDPAGLMQDEFIPVSTFSTKISQINTLAKGETVGYVRRGKIKADDTRIAVLAVGYADGYNRLFSNGAASVFIKGKRAPIVGNVCMDMCFADVTSIDCQVGDEVELFGPHINIQELADAAGTIDYEILTSIGARVRREYI